MSVSIIVAATSDLAIGVRGDMLYHISADLRRFRQLTLGHPVVMGRKTFESLPGGALPGRRNMVITRNPGFSAPGVEVFPSLESALGACGEDSPFIIGGGEIYRQAMPIASEIQLTEIMEERAADADTFFPAVDPDVWCLVGESPVETDPRSSARYRFLTYRRR